MYSMLRISEDVLTSNTKENISEKHHIQSSTTVPSLEDLINQIQAEIPQLTKSGAKKLAKISMQTFEEIVGKMPIGHFAGHFQDIVPSLRIYKWEDRCTMYCNLFPSGGFGLKAYVLPQIQADGITFRVISIPHTQEVSIHYVGED